MIRSAKCPIRDSLFARPARRRVLAGLGLIVATTLLLRLGLEIRAKTPQRGGIARIGQQFPSFRVADRDGHTLDLSSQGAGSKRVIVFFSPACRVCREVLPCLVPFPPRLRLIMVEVGEDHSAHALETPAEAVLNHDREKMFRHVFPMLGVPLILFVDRQNILRDGVSGTTGREVLQHKLRLFAGELEEAGR